MHWTQTAQIQSLELVTQGDSKSCAWVRVSGAAKGSLQPPTGSLQSWIQTQKQDKRNLVVGRGKKGSSWLGERSVWKDVSHNCLRVCQYTVQKWECLEGQGLGKPWGKHNALLLQNYHCRAWKRPLIKEQWWDIAELGSTTPTSTSFQQTKGKFWFLSCQWFCLIFHTAPDAL